MNLTPPMPPLLIATLLRHQSPERRMSELLTRAREIKDRIQQIRKV